MSSTEKKPIIRYLYNFMFHDGTEKKFEVVLDEATLELVREDLNPKPVWTKLKYSQCENCPLPDSAE